MRVKLLKFKLKGGGRYKMPSMVTLHILINYIILQSLTPFLWCSLLNQQVYRAFVKFLLSFSSCVT